MTNLTDNQLFVLCGKDLNFLENSLAKFNLIFIFA